MGDPLLVLSIVVNVAIALGYLGIGVWVTPKFDAAASRGLTAAKVFGLVFFITCAITHVEMAIHAATSTPMNYTAAHYLLNHLVQAIAAPAFLVTAVKFMSIRIYNHDLYSNLIERAISEQIAKNTQSRRKESTL